MRSLLRFVAYGVGVVLLVAVAAAVWAYYATQQVPAFYQQALKVDKNRLEQASDEMVRQTLDLASNTKTKGDWETTFTAEQINGWLAVDLPKNHREAMPREFRDPRMAISPQGIILAGRYETSLISTVASLHVDVSLQEDNVLALRFRKARAGTFPLPLKNILDELSRGAREAQVRLRWQTVENDPVALIDLPAMQDGKKVVVSIVAIELRDGEIYLRGRTKPAGTLSGRQITRLPFQRKVH